MIYSFCIWSLYSCSDSFSYCCLSRCSKLTLVICSKSRSFYAIFRLVSAVLKAWFLVSRSLRIYSRFLLSDLSLVSSSSPCLCSVSSARALAYLNSAISKSFCSNSFFLLAISFSNSAIFALLAVIVWFKCVMTWWVYASCSWAFSGFYSPTSCNCASFWSMTDCLLFIAVGSWPLVRMFFACDGFETTW